MTDSQRLESAGLQPEGLQPEGLQPEGLQPAAALASLNGVRLPNESAAYRHARDALLAEEIELRRHVERVAQQRRALPPGGRVPQDYRFDEANGGVAMSQLFGDKSTLAIYSMMYGPERKDACGMCASLLSAWDGEARDVEQHIGLVVTARSPIDRMLELKARRGWAHLRFVADVSGEFTRAYVSAEDADVPGFSVFTRRDGTVRHFWSGEMGAKTADPGQDPRGAPDLMPLWTILDCTPDGRGGDWYPKLEYATPQSTGR